MFQIRSAEDLGRAIADLRHEANRSQDAVAARIGIERSYLAKLEGGHSSPLVELIFDVLAELNATLVVTGRDEPFDG